MKKKFLYPMWIIVGNLLCVLMMLLLSAASGDTGYGGVIAVVGVMAVFCLIAVPLHCILYSRRVILSEKRKWLFVPYNAAWVALPYTVLLSMEPETYLYGLLLFAWATLWTAIPLLFPARKQASPTPAT